MYLGPWISSCLLSLVFVAETQAQCERYPGITIESSADASAIASCGTFIGDVAISSSASGDIVLDGIQNITGTLYGRETGLTSVTAAQLVSVGYLSFTDSSNLATLKFDSLTTAGSIQFARLPALRGLNFTTGISNVGSVTLTDTGLNSLSGIELSSVEGLQISSNRQLSTVNLPSLLEIGGLVIQGNGPNFEARFPNLESVNNVTLRNVSAFDAPLLKSIGNTLGIYSGLMTELSLPMVASISRFIIAIGNSELSTINLDSLSTVGEGIFMLNNSRLGQISFPSLETVSGYVNLEGSFDNVSLPALREIAEGAQFNTTGDFDCTLLDTAYNESIIKGDYSCISGLVAAANNDNSGTTSESNSSGSEGSGSDSGLSGGAIGGIVVGAIGLIIAILAIWWFYVRRKRRTLKNADAAKDNGHGQNSTGGVYEKAELPADVNQMPDQPADRHDLVQRDTGRSELPATSRTLHEFDASETATATELAAPVDRRFDGPSELSSHSHVSELEASERGSFRR